MLYPYLTLWDDTEICHSQIMEKDGKPVVEVHFEKPVESGFCSARCTLPDLYMAVQRRLLGKRDCIFRRVPAAQRTFAHQVRRNRRDSLCLNCSKSANISYSSGRMKTENRFMCISPKESRLHLRPKYGSHNREAVCWQITTAASPIRI